MGQRKGNGGSSANQEFMGNKNKSFSENEKINPYEMQRMERLQANIAKMEAKGFNKSLISKTLQDKYALVSKNVVAELSGQEELDDCQLEVPSHVDCSKPKSGKKPLVQTISMAEMMKLKTRERKKKTNQAKTNLAQHKQNEVDKLTSQTQANQQAQQVHQSQEPAKKVVEHKESQPKQSQQSHTSLKRQHQKSYCAPGTMSRYVHMRKKQGLIGQGMKSYCVPGTIQQPNVDDEMDPIEEDENSYDIVADASPNVGDGIENRGASPNVVNENENRVGASPNVVNGNDNRVGASPNVVDGNENRGTKNTKHRGRTHLEDIHIRTLEERDFVILNDLQQVVGPTRAIALKFGRFLGTLGRNHNFAPLNIINWHHMPTKDKIWEYIQSKYIIPDEAKEAVLSNLGNKWRNHKAELKKVHYSEDKTWEEMWDMRPDDVPECQFEELLDFWCTKEAQDMSKKNKENRAKQDDMHTLGPTSIALLRHEMQQSDPDKKCPLQAELYIKSRERTDGRTYLTPGDATHQNIEKMKALLEQGDESTKSDPYCDVMGKEEHSGRLRMFGQGVTKSKLKNKDPKNPFIIPPMLLDSISEQVEKRLEELNKRQEARFEQKFATMLLKIREAYPGADLASLDFSTNEGGASSSHKN